MRDWGILATVFVIGAAFGFTLGFWRAFILCKPTWIEVDCDDDSTLADLLNDGDDQ